MAEKNGNKKNSEKGGSQLEKRPFAPACDTSPPPNMTPQECKKWVGEETEKAKKQIQKNNNNYVDTGLSELQTQFAAARDATVATSELPATDVTKEGTAKMLPSFPFSGIKV